MIKENKKSSKSVKKSSRKSTLNTTKKIFRSSSLTGLKQPTLNNRERIIRSSSLTGLKQPRSNNTEGIIRSSNLTRLKRPISNNTKRILSVLPSSSQVSPLTTSPSSQDPLRSKIVNEIELMRLQETIPNVNEIGPTKSKETIPMETDPENNLETNPNVNEIGKSQETIPIKTGPEINTESTPMEIDPESNPEVQPTGLQEIIPIPFTISFVIFGHGGIKNEAPLERFKKPDNVEQTNVSGLRFSGINNMVNRHYEETIDIYLLEKKNMNGMFEELNKQFLNFLPNHPNVKQRVTELQQRTKIGNNFFGTRENYSHKRAQKFYTGITSNEIPHRHSQLKTTGPLVKIYSIIRNGEELLKGKEIIIHTNNGITLTQIINNVTKHILIVVWLLKNKLNIL